MTNRRSPSRFRLLPASAGTVRFSPSRTCLSTRNTPRALSRRAQVQAELEARHIEYQRGAVAQLESLSCGDGAKNDLLRLHSRLVSLQAVLRVHRLRSRGGKTAAQKAAHAGGTAAHGVHAPRRGSAAQGAGATAGPAGSPSALRVPQGPSAAALLRGAAAAAHHGAGSQQRHHPGHLPPGGGRWSAPTGAPAWRGGSGGSGASPGYAAADASGNLGEESDPAEWSAGSQRGTSGDEGSDEDENEREGIPEFRRSRVAAGLVGAPGTALRRKAQGHRAPYGAAVAQHASSAGGPPSPGPPAAAAATVRAGGGSSAGGANSGGAQAPRSASQPGAPLPQAPVRQPSSDGGPGAAARFYAPHAHSASLARGGGGATGGSSAGGLRGVASMATGGETSETGGETADEEHMARLQESVTRIQARRKPPSVSGACLFSTIRSSPRRATVSSLKADRVPRSSLHRHRVQALVRSRHARAQYLRLRAAALTLQSEFREFRERKAARVA